MVRTQDLPFALCATNLNEIFPVTIHSVDMITISISDRPYDIVNLHCLYLLNFIKILNEASTRNLRLNLLFRIKMLVLVLIKVIGISFTSQCKIWYKLIILILSLLFILFSCSLINFFNWFLYGRPLVLAKRLSYTFQYFLFVLLKLGYKMVSLCHCRHLLKYTVK